MSISILNRGASGGLKPELTVTAPSGSTIDLLQNGIIVDTYTLGASETEHTFVVKVGTYTVQGTLGEKVQSKEAAIEVAGQYEVEIDYKLWLYREGDECESVTGGWASDGRGTYQVTKNSNDIYLYGQYVRDQHFGSAAIATENTVDKSDYSFLCIEYFDFSYSGTPNDTDYECHFAGKLFSSLSSNGVLKNAIKDTTTSIIDIWLSAGTLNGTLTASVKIKNVWLE